MGRRLGRYAQRLETSDQDSRRRPQTPSFIEMNVCLAYLSSGKGSAYISTVHTDCGFFFPSLILN